MPVETPFEIDNEPLEALLFYLAPNVGRFGPVETAGG
jgi:hypothetical protein